MYHLKGTPGMYRLITCTLLVPASGRVNIWSADDVALLEQQGFVQFDPNEPTEAEVRAALVASLTAHMAEEPQATAETAPTEPDGKIADEDGPAPAKPRPPRRK